jgi:HEAT repeat protein
VASNQKKILHYHIARLQDRQREVRLASIRELEEMGDPEALGPLQTVFDSDADIDVRRAAQAAGRNIFLRSRGQK